MTTVYLHDGDREIGEYDATGTLQARHVYGAGLDEPVAMIDGAGTISFAQQDGHGSVVEVTDQSQAVVQQFAYGAYGETAAVAGYPFRYAGRRFEPETGLYDDRARMYAPALGRFMQPDPIGTDGGINLYAYVGNDPVNLADPSGLWQVTLTGGIFGVGGSFTLGHNSGQWNVGAWGGIGAGLSIRINPFDTGTMPTGYDVSMAVRANYRLGILGGGSVGYQHSFVTGTSTIAASRSTGLGTNVSGSVSTSGDVHAAPTIGFGSSTFAGVGVTWTSEAQTEDPSPVSRNTGSIIAPISQPATIGYTSQDGGRS